MYVSFKSGVLCCAMGERVVGNVDDCMCVCFAMDERASGNIGDWGYMCWLDKDRDRVSFLRLVLVVTEWAGLMIDVVIHGGPSHFVSSEDSYCRIVDGIMLDVVMHGGPSHLVNIEGSCCCVGEGCFFCCRFGVRLQLDVAIKLVVPLHRIGDGVDAMQDRLFSRGGDSLSA